MKVKTSKGQVCSGSDSGLILKQENFDFLGLNPSKSTDVKECGHADRSHRKKL